MATLRKNFEGIPKREFKIGIGQARGTPVPVNNLPKRLHRRCFIILHIKNGVQLRDLQQIVHLLRQVEQLQLATLVLNSRECTDQLANSRAVDIVHIAEVQQNLLVSFCEQVFDCVAEHNAAFTERNAPIAIDNVHSINLAGADSQIHWDASLPPPASPWTCLISLISVPVLAGWISTSSIKERIKKIPRPDVFKRLSGASGSGMLAGSKPLP